MINSLKFTTWSKYAHLHILYFLQIENYVIRNLRNDMHIITFVKGCKTKLLVDDVVPGFSQHMFLFHMVIFLFCHIDYINFMHAWYGQYQLNSM